MIYRVTVLSRDQRLLRGLSSHLDEINYLIESVKDADDMLAYLSQQPADMVLIGSDLKPQIIERVIALAADLPDAPEILVLSNQMDDETKAELIARGCHSVLSSQLPAATVAKVMSSVLEKRRREVRAMNQARDIASPSLNDFVSASPAMQTFMRVVRRVAKSDVSLLILGETGVGKERLARALHAEGQRSEGPFVAVNCGALTETLLESELFGHEKGAFTGASRTRRGWFELAHGGTIFLDEIGEIPRHLQLKLLRVLQDHEIQPVGGERTIHVNVRVMAATNTDLEQEVKAGRFRRDLFYRLNVITLTIPPLCERREDIPELIESYMDYFSARVGHTASDITDEARAALIKYDWPGNVRELINVIERAILLADNGVITLHDLPDTITANRPKEDQRLTEDWLNLPVAEIRKIAAEKAEHAYLNALLTRNEGRIRKTADDAGITTRALYERMKTLGLRKESFK
ncbi:MAG: sigma-54 dependent transcriptional regulator [Verrucomicrobia bacterium]|nr:sigma-54 dependent transcriptional regulator [Verrucomicrobiota bacterium]